MVLSSDQSHVPTYFDKSTPPSVGIAELFAGQPHSVIGAADKLGQFPRLFTRTGVYGNLHVLVRLELNQSGYIGDGLRERFVSAETFDAFLQTTNAREVFVRDIHVGT